MTQYTILVDPVEWGKDGTYGWEEDEDIYLDLDPSYSDKVNFSFKSILQTEIVQPAEWLRVAKNVARYNKEMYKNWAEYFFRVLHHKLVNAMSSCKSKDEDIIGSLYQLARFETLEDLLSSCQSFINVTKDKNLYKAIEDLRDDMQTILKEWR